MGRDDRECLPEANFDLAGDGFPAVQEISAEVPLASMFGYVNDLRSMTQGRGTYTMQFEKYARVPENVAQGIVYH